MDPLADQIHRLLATLASEPGQASTARPKPGAIRSLLAEHFALDRPLVREEFIGALTPLFRDTSASTDHPLAFGATSAGSRDAGLAASVLENALGLLPAAWSLAPAVIELEGLLLDQIVQQVGMDQSRTVARVCESGEEAQLEALIVAATQCFPEFESDGVHGLEGRPRLYVSSACADPWRKRAHAVGLGRSAVRAIECDRAGRIDVRALRTAVIADAKAGDTPFFVVAGVGAASTGAIDEVKRLVAFGRVQGMWVHVDGSGLGLGIYSTRLSDELQGIAFADSIALDTRGGLPAAGSAGFFLCRHPRPVSHAFSVDDPRLPLADPQAAEPRLGGLLGARRCAALPFLFLLAELGTENYAARLDRLCERAEDLRALLRDQGCEVEASGAEPVVCFQAPGLETEAQFLELAASLREEEGVWIDAIRLPDGAARLRAWIMSLTTSPSDLQALLTALQAQGAW